MIIHSCRAIGSSGSAEATTHVHTTLDDITWACYSKHEARHPRVSAMTKNRIAIVDSGRCRCGRAWDHAPMMRRSRDGRLSVTVNRMAGVRTTEYRFAARGTAGCGKTGGKLLSGWAQPKRTNIRYGCAFLFYSRNFNRGSRRMDRCFAQTRSVFA